MPRYQVIATGFTVNCQTYDNASQKDGKGDEVYIYHDVRVFDSSGAPIARVQDRSTVIGDTNGYPNRVGSPLKTGTSYPSSTPWILDREVTNEKNYPPMLLWEGELTENNAVMITPIIVEWDNGNSFKLDEWTKSLNDVETKVSEVLMQTTQDISARISAGAVIEITLLVIDAAKLLVPFIINFAGRAADRPIGIIKENYEKVFKPQCLVLNSIIADAALSQNFGKGEGVLSIQFKEPRDWLDGDYTLYIKIEKTSD